MKQFLLFSFLIFTISFGGCGRISPVKLPENVEFKDFTYPPKPPEETALPKQQPILPNSPDAPWRDEPLQSL